MATIRPGRAVHSPNLGLYRGVPPLLVPERGMIDCLNVRIKQGAVVKDTLGWGPFPDGVTALNLDSKPVLLIEEFIPRNDNKKLVLANTTDFFLYFEGSGTVFYLTRRYAIGTVTVTNGDATVVGVGTSWLTELKAGDFFHSGISNQTALTAIWYEILSITNDTNLELVTVYNESSLGGQAYTARQTLTGDIETPFFTETFLDAVDVVGTDGDRIYFTNGVDPVAAWDGITGQVYLPNLGNIQSCKALRKFKNALMYIAPTIAGIVERKIRSSAIAEPENVVTKEAAEFVVHDGVDVPLNAIEFGELLVVYSERHITLMQFIGTPLHYIFRTAVSGFGPRSGRAIAQFSDKHLFIAADGEYEFDGARAIQTNTHVWRDMTREISPQRLEMIQAHFDEENGELIWVLPRNGDADPDAGSPETALVHHYLEDVGLTAPGPHTLRELPATATGYFQQSGSITWAELTSAWTEFNFRWNDQALQDAFPQGLFGTSTGKVFIISSQDSQDGTEITAFARFSRRPLGFKNRKGTVKRVYAFIEHIVGATHKLQVRVRGSITADGPSTQLSDDAFDIGVADEKNFVSPLVTARYAEIEVGTVAQAGPWRVSGYDLDIIQAGDV